MQWPEYVIRQNAKGAIPLADVPDIDDKALKEAEAEVAITKLEITKEAAKIQ